MTTTKTYNLQQGTDRITVTATSFLEALAQAYRATGKDRWSLAATDELTCEICDRNVTTVDDDGFCEACTQRGDGIMIAQSALEELKSIQRKLEAQIDYFENATDEQVAGSARQVKRLIEAHDCLEDAGTRAAYGLSTDAAYGQN